MGGLNARVGTCYDPEEEKHYNGNRRTTFVTRRKSIRRVLMGQIKSDYIPIRGWKGGLSLGFTGSEKET